jgi:CheY-like chemotaxis protein
MDTDEAKVAQILRNLISNALKFTEEGEVRVSAVHHPDQGTVEFQVADTGVGIEPEHRERIFQEFSQLENPMQRRHKGTGLGLPLSRRLAELLGGELWVTGGAGGGSIFSALIPAVVESGRDREREDLAATEAKQSDAPRASAPRRPRAPLGRAGSVLVVDDEDASQYVIGRVLAGTAFRILRAVDGAEGLRIAAAERPRAILLDLRMPGMSGEEVLDRLEGDPGMRGVPVLIVSSRVLSDVERGRLAPRVAAIVAKNDLASEAGRRQILDVLDRLAPSADMEEVRDGESVDHSQR